VDSAAGRDRSVEGSKRRHPASLSPLSCPVGALAEKAGENTLLVPGRKETAASSSPVSLLRLQIPVLKDSQFLGPRPLLARLCLSIVACSRGDCKNSIFWFARLPDFLLSVSCRGAIFSPTCVQGGFRLARLARHFPATSLRSLRDEGAPSFQRPPLTRAGIPSSFFRAAPGWRGGSADAFVVCCVNGRRFLVHRERSLMPVSSWEQVPSGWTATAATF